MWERVLRAEQLLHVMAKWHPNLQAVVREKDRKRGNRVRIRLGIVDHEPVRGSPRASQAACAPRSRVFVMGREVQVHQLDLLSMTMFGGRGRGEVM